MFQGGIRRGHRRAVRLIGAQFGEQDKKANFNSMKVGRSAFFHNAVFRGPVNFGNADIKRQFNADGAQFENTEKKANFNGLKVGHDTFFSCRFPGAGGFHLCRYWQAVRCSRSSVLKPEEAVFECIQVGQSTFLEGVTFNGQVALNHAHLLDLMMGGNAMPALNLERTCIDRELIIANSEIGTLEARNLTVRGPSTLGKVTISKKPT